MNAADLETYEYQLSQVKLALAKDPTNTEYHNLKEELQSLIDLTKEYLLTQSTAASSSTHTNTSTSSTAAKPPATATASTSSTARPGAASSSTSPRRATGAGTVTAGDGSSQKAADGSARRIHQFQAGDECLAKYSGDGKYYPARITTIGGSDENRVFSIVFHGYQSTEIVSLKDLKPAVPGAESRKRGEAQPESEADAEKERKRKKYEKKAETQATKTQEQGLKQKSWQQFAKKGAKKGIVIPGVQGGSMFKSPEDLNPQAKVGVVGSGRGMTKAQERKKQTFGADAA